MAEKPRKRTTPTQQLRVLVELTQAGQQAAERSTRIITRLTWALVGLTLLLVLLTLALLLRG